MKGVRQFFAAPFFALGFVVFGVSVCIELVGSAVVFLGVIVEGDRND